MEIQFVYKKPNVLVNLEQMIRFGWMVEATKGAGVSKRASNSTKKLIASIIRELDWMVMSCG